MDANYNKITIQADYREMPSQIPQLLSELGAQVEVKTLKRGDYILNEQIIVERKSKSDFVQSLVQNRLFAQCAMLKKTNYHPTLLIEGNPYTSGHDISRQAVKGALLSVSLSWQIPIIFSSDAPDSAQTLIMAAEQNLRDHLILFRTATKPKTRSKQQIYFLKGLPLVGAKTAQALINHFGSIERIMLADEVELQEVEGIGKDKAAKIRRFIAFDASK
ncbi:MAG: hypothetical protein K9H64_23485 [Bacteroidales bacterium]|nr:hypothetical protein [Bacteroidales bacterium]MCF8458989.1 hypothetical protein [Bacteroidales bacterium]